MLPSHPRNFGNMGCDNFSGSKDQQPLRLRNLDDDDGDDPDEDGRENGGEIGHNNDAGDTSDGEDDTSDSDSLEDALFEDLPPDEEHEAVMAELRFQNQLLLEEVAAQDAVLAQMALRTAEIQALTARREVELHQLRISRAAREAVGQSRPRLGSTSVVDHTGQNVTEPEPDNEANSDEDEIKWGAACKLSSAKSLSDWKKGPDNDDVCGPKVLSNCFQQSGN